ncbi:MAG: nuclear transport factor 2 family protein [Bacteroidota bacterium]
MSLSRFLLLFLFCTPLLSLQAQSELESRAAVVQSLHTLFDAMKQGDTTGMSAIFHPNAQLLTVSELFDGSKQLRKGSLDDFREGIAGAEPDILVERLYQIEVRVDGDLATAWTPYRFEYQGAVSHCGVNSFQLVRSYETGVWQIVNIIDTRRRGDCPDMPETLDEEDRLNTLVDDWHQAATDADSAAYFGLMDEESIFIGTDATEHWTRAEFIEFAAPYFAEGKAWDFTAIERHFFISPDRQLVYWDELLDTWMGPCRGTGIAERQFDGSYLIKHYTLSVTVPNEKIEGFIELTQE